MSKGKKHFEFMKTLDGHMDAVWASCASHVNDDLYTSSWDGRIGVWDIVTSDLLTVVDSSEKCSRFHPSL